MASLTFTIGSLTTTKTVTNALAADIVADYIASYGVFKVFDPSLPAPVTMTDPVQ